jgi:hypothetical protein
MEAKPTSVDRPPDLIALFIRELGKKTISSV